MPTSELIMPHWPWCSHCPTHPYNYMVYTSCLNLPLNWTESSFLSQQQHNMFIMIFNCPSAHCVFNSAPGFLVASFLRNIIKDCLFVFLLVENVPAELRDPFYCDQYEQEHLKPPVTRLLQSSELYCRTYSLILGGPGSEAQPKDNAALLELLTQRGIVSKDKDTPVTDADLRHKPIKMVKLYE